MEWRDIFLGVSGYSKRKKMCNTLINIMKFVIYKARTEGAVPSIEKIHRIILDYREEEKKIATEMGKLGSHLQKWELAKLD